MWNVGPRIQKGNKNKIVCWSKFCSIPMWVSSIFCEIILLKTIDVLGNGCLKQFSWKHLRTAKTIFNFYFSPYRSPLCFTLLAVSVVKQPMHSGLLHSRLLQHSQLCVNTPSIQLLNFQKYNPIPIWILTFYNSERGGGGVEQESRSFERSFISFHSRSHDTPQTHHTINSP